jgi:exonuclease III
MQPTIVTKPNKTSSSELFVLRKSTQPSNDPPTSLTLQLSIPHSPPNQTINTEFIAINIQGSPFQKTHSVIHYMKTNCIPVAFLSEIWLSWLDYFRYVKISKDYHVIVSIPPKGEIHLGKGVAIIIRKSWVSSILATSRNIPGQSATLVIQDINGTNWIFESLYIPRYRRCHTKTIKYLSKYLLPIEQTYQSLSFPNKRLLVMGDFNQKFSQIDTTKKLEKTTDVLPLETITSNLHWFHVFKHRHPREKFLTCLASSGSESGIDHAFSKDNDWLFAKTFQPPWFQTTHRVLRIAAISSQHSEITEKPPTLRKWSLHDGDKNKLFQKNTEHISSYSVKDWIRKIQKTAYRFLPRHKPLNLLNIAQNSETKNIERKISKLHKRIKHCKSRKCKRKIRKKINNLHNKLKKTKSKNVRDFVQKKIQKAQSDATNRLIFRLCSKKKYIPWLYSITKLNGDPVPTQNFLIEVRKQFELMFRSHPTRKKTIRLKYRRIPNWAKNQYKFEPYDLDSLKRTIHKNKNRKTPGWDFLTKEILLNIHDNALQQLVNHLNEALLHKKMPKPFRLVELLPIPKISLPLMSTNTRPISFLSLIAKLYTTKPANDIVNLSTNFHLISEENQAYMKGRKTSNQGRILRNTTQDATRNKHTVWILFFDISNAFGSAVRKQIIKTMQRMNFPQFLIDMVRNIYSEYFFVVLTGKGTTDIGKTIDGILQGDILSCIIFILTITETIISIVKELKVGYKSPTLPNTPLLDILAWADDFNITAINQQQCEKLGNKLLDATNYLKLKIKPTSLHLLVIKNGQVKRGPNYYVVLRRNSPNPITVQATSLDDFHKYLGFAQGGSNERTQQCEELLQNFQINLKSINWIKTNIKQTNALIHSKLITPITYHSTMNLYTKKWITAINVLIKRLYKEQLSLPAYFSSAAIYYKGSSLGLPNIQSIDNRIFFYHIIESLNSPFSKVKYSTRDRLKNEMQRLGPLWKTKQFRSTYCDIRRFLKLLQQYNFDLVYDEPSDVYVVSRAGTQIQQDELKTFLKNDEQKTYYLHLKHNTWWWNIKQVDHRLSDNILDQSEEKYKKFLIKARTQALALKTLRYSWNKQGRSYEPDDFCPTCQTQYDTLHHLPECQFIPVNLIWNQTKQKLSRDIPLIHSTPINLHVIFDEQISIRPNTQTNLYIGHYGAVNKTFQTGLITVKHTKAMLKTFYQSYIKYLFENWKTRFVNNLA